MRTQLRLTIWIVLIIGPLLNACGEVLNEYYISNHTDNELTVRFTPIFMETVDLASGPLIEDIQRSARSSLSQAVEFDQDEDSIQFLLPARTTVFLGISSGGNELFTQLEAGSDGWQLVVDENHVGEYFSVHDNFIGAVVHVLNVK
jgi:hypothetical protein